MSSTDDRIVRMQFDNASFKKGAADTQKSLADLDKAVAGAGKSRGLMDLSSQMQQVSVTASNMAVVTTSALATIASKATTAGLNMAKALTFDPIKQGFLEYEELLTKQNTIMNATGKSAQEVKGYLTDLNHYSDQTIYSFGNMTASIVKFVNAGISLPDSVKSIKGIANAAAYAGASTEEANRAMYAFSQSMGTGFLMLNDWMQIENANMGTIQFKEQLIEAAVAAGTLTKKGNEFVTSSGKIVTATKGWREGLQDQWATTKVMNTALAKYTDLQTKLGREATQSATEVRTFSAFMDTLKESLGSGWSTVFTSLIGNLKQATTFWTTLSETVGGSVGSFFDFLGVSLKVWRNMGGFEKTMQGFSNLMAPFAAILDTIGKAWSKAFPDSDRGAGKALYGLSKGFEAVTSPLQLLADLIRGTTPLLTIFFKAIKLGGTIVKSIGSNIADFIKDLFGLVNLDIPSGGGFVAFIKDIAKAVSKAISELDELIARGASLGSALGSVSIDMPSMPNMPKMPKMPDLSSMFAGAGGATSQIATLTGGLKDLASGFLDMGSAAEDSTKSVMEAGVESETLGDKMEGGFSGAVEAVKNFLTNISMDNVVSSFNMAVLATMGISVARFINTLTKSFRGFVGIGESITGVLDSAGNALNSFQTQARAQLILNIAIALGILAAALWVLSTIPMDKMATGLTGLSATMLIMGLMMKQMTGIVEQLDGKAVNLKLIALSIALAGLGFAMMELAIALKIMNSVDWMSIVKGLTTMFVMLKLLENMGKLGPHAAKTLLGAAVAMVAMGAAMMILAGALIAFKLVDWESIAKGGVVLAGLTLALGALALIPYAGIAKVGVAMLTASIGMLAIANALILFGLVSWESIGKAAVVLLALTVALGALMIVGNPVSVGAIIAMGAAMLYLSFALQNLNSVDWSSIGKMALVMGVLVVAFAAFLGVMAIFTPVLIVLSGFAGSLALLALAITGLALAFAVIFPLLAAGAGAFAAFATGAAIAIAVFFQTLAAEAPVMKDAFLKILKALLDGMVEAVPMVIDSARRMWDAIMKELGGGGGGSAKAAQMNATSEGWVSRLADGIRDRLPTIIAKATELFIAFLQGLTSRAAQLASAGVAFIAALIRGIASRIGDIVDSAIDLIVKFAQALGQGLGEIVQAGVNLIGQFLHDLASAIRSSSGIIGSGIADVADAMVDVGVDMVQGLIDGVVQMGEQALSAIGNLASDMVGRAKSILDIFSPSRVFRDIGKFIVQGLTNGIQQNAATAITATARMIEGQIAVSEDLVNRMIQRLDQKAIEARGKAEGLAKAAGAASKAADETEKNKTDDKTARRLDKRAKQADKAADAAEKRAQREKAAEARRRRWENADALERANIRSNDAANAIKNAKAAEKEAEAKRIEANALDAQAKAAGYNKQQRAEFRREADRLRKQARDDAKRANSSLQKARDAAKDAMEWQYKAGSQASKAFAEQYRDEARADREAAAFEKLTAEEKAIAKREEAAQLRARSEENLAKARRLAFKDIERANAVADQAMSQAQRARDLLEEAKRYSDEAKGEEPPAPGQVVSLQPTDAAAIAFNDYSDLYDSAYAAAASGMTFNQYNSSPEALNPSEIYRQTNNLVTYAADKINPSAA